MIRRQSQGQCEVRGHPWEVAPYRAAIQRMRLHVIEESDMHVMALCSKPQWADVQDYATGRMCL